MNPEPVPPVPQEPSTPDARRLFLREPGWRVALKVGSERAFCYTMAPGQDFYHRLLDGEVYAVNGDERICIACAVRRGLLSYEGRALGGGAVTFPDHPIADVSPLPLKAETDGPDV